MKRDYKERFKIITYHLLANTLMILYYIALFIISIPILIYSLFVSEGRFLKICNWLLHAIDLSREKLV